jgi:hypothetical protein
MQPRREVVEAPAPVARPSSAWLVPSDGSQVRYPLSDEARTASPSPRSVDVGSQPGVVDVGYVVDTLQITRP